MSHSFPSLLTILSLSFAIPPPPDRAMQFLKDCYGVLKIEDILPFFSDVVTIDQFKVD